jgi:hypothetical protein
MIDARRLILALFALAIPLGAIADDWKDESGKGKGRKHERREFKEEYWDGNCKVERKMEGNGDYKEERKCKGRRADYRQRRDHREPVIVHVPRQQVVVDVAPRRRVVRPVVEVQVPVPRVRVTVEPRRSNIDPERY